MKIFSAQMLAHASEKMIPLQTLSNKQSFGVSKYIALVPTFRKTEVEYFSGFQRIATACIKRILSQLQSDMLKHIALPFYTGTDFCFHICKP